MGIRCSKSLWDDFKTVEEVCDTTFLYYGFVRFSKRFITLKPIGRAVHLTSQSTLGKYNMLAKDDLFQILNHALLDYITLINEKSKQLL